MPIEIRELVIKAFVVPTETQDQDVSDISEEKTGNMLEESLEQVMDLLNNKNER